MREGERERKREREREREKERGSKIIAPSWLLLRVNFGEVFVVFNTVS